MGVTGPGFDVCMEHFAAQTDIASSAHSGFSPAQSFTEDASMD